MSQEIIGEHLSPKKFLPLHPTVFRNTIEIAVGELVYGIHVVLCRFEGCQNADVIDAAWAFVRKISDFS